MYHYPTITYNFSFRDTVVHIYHQRSHSKTSSTCLTAERTKFYISGFFIDIICPVKFNLEVMYRKALATVATGNTEQLQPNPLEMLCDSLTRGLSLFWGSEQPWHMLTFLYEVGKSRCLSLCPLLSGFSRSPALLLSYSDRRGTARHLVTILRMVCKWKLKNCSFLEFFSSVFVGQGWLWVTGTVETRGTRCSIAQKSGLLRVRLGGIVESWWRNMGMVRPLLGKAQGQWRVRKGEIFRW